MSQERLEEFDSEYPTTSCLVRALVMGLILLGAGVFAVIAYWAWRLLEWYYAGW